MTMLAVTWQEGASHLDSVLLLSYESHNISQKSYKQSWLLPKGCCFKDTVVFQTNNDERVPSGSRDYVQECHYIHKVIYTIV